MMILLVTTIILIILRINEFINRDNRFQESNKLERMWRYRFYLRLPFLWTWHNAKGLKVYRDEWVDDNMIHTDQYDLIKGINLWKILKGKLDYYMKWYYTTEEVFNEIDMYIEKYKKDEV